MAEPEPWTPYGLEHIRASRLWRRRAAVLVLIGALFLAYLGFAQSGILSKSTQICDTAGNCNTQSIGFDIGSSSDHQQTGPDATVAVQPGGTARVESGTPADEAPAQSTAPPPYTADPIDWLALLVKFGPLLVLGALVWLGFRRRASPEDEVNFGVYKGAMPLEMITASHAHLVLSTKRARKSLFGKAREDHLPAAEGEP